LGQDQCIRRNFRAAFGSIGGASCVEKGKQQNDGLKSAKPNKIAIETEHLRLHRFLLLALCSFGVQLFGAFLWGRNRYGQWLGGLLIIAGAIGLLSLGGAYVFGSASTFWRFGWL